MNTMGMADAVTKQYMKENTVFADAFNFLLYNGDKLIPVITLVIHFGADKWDAPMSLHEMMAVTDKGLLQHIPDYRIKLIDPAGIDSDEMDKFQTSLREVLSYIKYSKDADKLAEYMNHNQRMEHLEVSAAQVIREVTNTKFQIPKGTEKVNMCEAIEVLMNRRENEGIQLGLERGIS